MKKTFLTCCFLIAILCIHKIVPGQVDSILTLSEVEITTSTIREAALGGETKSWKGKELQGTSLSSLADLLGSQTSAYIKSYGLGSLASSSIRGGSAGHTLILWNGLPIQSPMLGQLDLALLPVSASESITFQKGGNSALWGSGAIGGVIALNNKTDFNNRLHLSSQTTLGNFGRIQEQFQIGIGNSRFQSKTKVFFRKAENDFFYTPAPGIAKRQQSNARLMQRNLLQDFYWKPNEQNSLSFHVWRQDSEREIPPTNVQVRSEAHQEDQSLRLTGNWKHFTKKSILQAKAGFFDEYLNYFDDQIGLVSRSHFQTFLGETNLQHYLRKQHQVYVGVTHSFTRAWAQAYQDVPSEQKSALFTSWKWDKESFQLQANLRQELVNQTWTPIVPGLAFSYQALPLLQFKGKISRNYRLPTFNDRFWRPGGNEDLLPESGWSEEVSIISSIKKGKLSLSGSLTGFSRNIDNWIMWSIIEGQSYWSANNITEVWSRGLEPRINLQYQSKNIGITWEAGYDYIRSTNQQAIETPRMAVGEQLLYTPIHQAFTSASITWKSFYLSYQHSFKGMAQGIYAQIDPFQVANLRLQYKLRYKDFSSTCFFRINNVWNSNYFVIERRPMPGINYQFGLNISLSKNQNL